MSRIAAIHDPLRDIDSCSRDVHSLVHISDLIYRPAVNAHPELNSRMSFCRLTNF